MKSLICMALMLLSSGLFGETPEAPPVSAPSDPAPAPDGAPAPEPKEKAPEKPKKSKDKSKDKVKDKDKAAESVLEDASLASGKAVPILAEQQNAYIYLESTNDYSKDPSLAKNWKEFCDQLGKGLSINAQVPGFLASHSCLPLGLTDQPSRPPAWRIRIIEQKRFFEVEAAYYAKPEGYRKVRSFSFRFEGDLLVNLKGETLALVIARMLAESLPLGWSYLHDGSQSEIVFKVGKDLPLLPPELVVYELAFDPKKKIWIPSVRATMKRKNSKKFDLTSRQDSYEISHGFAPLKDKQRYWLQNAQGLSKQQAEYEKAMSAQMKGLSLLSLLDRLIFDSFESNYGGFRYGKSFLKGSSIVTEADLLSILVEMRSGLFAGLRWYYDLSPEVRRGLDEEAEFFRMSRISLGWAFDFEMPAPLSMLVSRVEVQPKFGLLDVKTKFTVLNDAGENVSLSFDAKNAYDLAIELGAEKESYWFRTRLWAAFSAAMFGVSNKQNTSVVSSKAGLDAYWDLFEWGSLDFNLLTFALAERLTLSKDGGQIDEEAELGIAEVGFNFFFVGGGFTLSW